MIAHADMAGRKTSRPQLGELENQSAPGQTSLTRGKSVGVGNFAHGAITPCTCTLIVTVVLSFDLDTND